VRTCGTCGQPISPSIGECLYCPAPTGGAVDSIVPDILRPPPLPPLIVPAPAVPAPPVAAPLPAPPPAAAPAPAPPVLAPPAAPPAAAAPGPAAPAPDADGLQNDAERALASGEVERALVLASKVVKQRPESVAARSLYERARRELLRGLRRERLEARVREADRMITAGDFAGAERIVTSALKLLPDHAVALELFGKLKARRLAGDTAAAEAERELQRLGARQARQAVAAAQTAIANGWDRRALLAVRRGLRLVPDDAELLALLRELQGAEGDQDPQRAHRRALQSQVRAALELLARKKLDESLAMLRAVLSEDPDNTRAQDAVQQVRRAWLRRTRPPVAILSAASPAASPPSPPAPPAPSAAPVPRPAAPAAPRPVAAAVPPAPVIAPPAPRPARAAVTETVAAARPAAATAAADEAPLTGRFRIPRVEPPAPATRPAARTTPALFMAGGAAVVLAGAMLMSRERPAPAAAPSVAPTVAPTAEVTSTPGTLPPVEAAPAPAESPTPEPPGPLTGLDPDLRQAVEATLTSYGQALEAQDDARLARARPDLGARQRAALLAPFKGALNVATDLRVLEVTTGREDAVVTVLRTDVIVDGRGGARPPVEEALRFVRRGGTWTLGGGSH
jgi:tetratricopeptide (TPR) repeat protein